MNPIVLLLSLTLGLLAFPRPVERSGDAHYEGMWRGIITQESGATTRYFDMSMVVSRRMDEDSLYDVSSHVEDGDYHAYMEGSGFIGDDGKLYIAEHAIIRSDSIPGMEWCLKRLWVKPSLEDRTLHLRGWWEGDTGFGPCEPGYIDLVQAIIRP